MTVSQGDVPLLRPFMLEDGDAYHQYFMGGVCSHINFGLFHDLFASYSSAVRPYQPSGAECSIGITMVSRKDDEYGWFDSEVDSDSDDSEDTARQGKHQVDGTGLVRGQGSSQVVNIDGAQLEHRASTREEASSWSRDNTLQTNVATRSFLRGSARASAHAQGMAWKCGVSALLAFCVVCVRSHGFLT